MGREKPGPPQSFVVCRIPPCDRRLWVQGPHQQIRARLVHPGSLPPDHAKTILDLHLDETHGITHQKRPGAHLVTFGHNGPKGDPLDFTPPPPSYRHERPNSPLQPRPGVFRGRKRNI